ncbi:MAG: AlkZ family DNA glycosylase [Acidobacteria bacterium]|nr:AlkZ family DNA glycosylase [Acidobacteriota bacterium]
MAAAGVNAVLWRAVRAHGLLEPVKGAKKAVVRAAGVYGAAPTCYLSLASRAKGFQSEDLDHALNEKRSLVRVPAMRGSVYILPVELAPFGLALAGSVGLEGLLNRAGLEPAQYARVSSAIENVLAEGPRTAAEIRQGIQGWREPHAGLLTLVLRRMSHEGRIVRSRVRGGWRSQSFEYARFADWLGVPLCLPARQEAMRRLAPFYFEANGPATVADFAWWAGASKAEAAGALKSVRLETVAVEGLEGTLLATPQSLQEMAKAPARWNDIHLLPYWDPYVMAHAGRRRYLDPRWADRVIDRGGNATNVVLKAGRVAGVWDFEQGTLLFASFDNLDAKAVREAAARCLGPLGVERVKPAPPPGPLARAGQNAFMAPLR